MNKKVILSWLSLVTMVATIAYSPVAASNMTTSIPGSASSSGSSENVIQLIPEVQRVGVVVAYSPGQSITIVDRHSNQFTFELASPLKIVPAHRAGMLARGTFVTIIAPNNVPGGKQIAVGIVIHPGVPRGFLAPSPTFTPVPSETPTPGPPLEFPAPVFPSIPPEDKPSLAFSPFDMSSLPPLQTIVGYTFPSDFADWVMPIRVAAFEDISIDSAETFTPVGVVEIGSEQTDPSIFLVAIDLVSTGAEVQGRLLSITTTDTLDVIFQRMPQILNPERTDSPYEEFQELAPAPDSFSTIFAGGVCFVVTTADGPIKFCSKPSGPAEPAPLLSVSDNFPLQYANLQDLISEVAGQFGLQNVIQMDQIVSMQEDVQHIQDCASQLTQEACGADIVVAPVNAQYFEQKYNQKFGGDDGDDGEDDDGEQNVRSQFDIAAVKVLRPIETSDGTIQPGDYRMDYWFDANGVFYAATLTGVTTDNIQVTNQPVPAVPATFINEDGTEQAGAQISACRIIGHCAFWQRTCG